MHYHITASADSKKAAKKPSAYNEYMKVQLAKLKADNEKAGKTNNHKENFKKVAESWKTSSENPVSTVRYEIETPESGLTSLILTIEKQEVID
ncbi:uncharacterized protein I303_105263 [Kwoniella dejecticola CBS 10117]|uniref:HMG box domain-containing protein n=1 Tax=Kwoniella dejecticola CBS 10117 TaxID=1296121 RepID=A0A1A6A2Z1_9TREE|nr:uncharacterized protein I303_05289 [Kwoniella dejecticola CBS 10117]OBR84431.1 hypothetical protein I303_05289 [Kwoniella dejecticola CBS 10117]